MVPPHPLVTVTSLNPVADAPSASVTVAEILKDDPVFVYAYEFEVVAIGVADPIRHANEYGETPPLTATLHVAGTCGSTMVGPASAPIARGLVVDRRGTCIWSNASTSACNTLCERVSSLCETSCTDSVACVHPGALVKKCVNSVRRRAVLGLGERCGYRRERRRHRRLRYRGVGRSVCGSVARRPAAFSRSAPSRCRLS